MEFNIYFPLILVIFATVITLGYVFVLFHRVSRVPINDDKIETIHKHIHDGAMTFLIREYKLDKNPDELCDVLEVVYALAEARGMSVEELEGKRLAKRERRGGFDEKIYLIETDE